MNGEQLQDQDQLAIPANFEMRLFVKYSPKLKVDLGSSQEKQNACAIQASLQLDVEGFLPVWSHADRWCGHSHKEE